MHYFILSTPAKHKNFDTQRYTHILACMELKRTFNHTDFESYHPVSPYFSEGDKKREKNGNILVRFYRFYAILDMNIFLQDLKWLLLRLKLFSLR